jgi:mono/diheme cytochrome c family protein
MKHPQKKSPHARRVLAARLLAAAALVPLVAGCFSGSSSGSGTAQQPDGPWTKGVALTAEAQTVGDADVGRTVLLNGSYMSCGVPVKLWNDPGLGPVVQKALRPDGDLDVKGREGPNAKLPHTLNQFTTADGAEVIQRNCLSCHSGRFDGKLVIGMGNATADFTGGFAGDTPTSPLPDSLLTQLGLSDAEKSNLNKVLRIGRAFGPETVMRTIGQNPAESFTGVLLAHHDQKTLAWTDTPTIPVVVKDADGTPIADPKLTSDPPPWWRAKKKNAMFYNGMARGDHRGTMELATAVCVDTLDEAKRVDDLFKDIQAYIGTIEAPLYARHVDAAKAARGKDAFTQTCSGCHGTYAKDPLADDQDTYPNLLIPLDTIGTDEAVANMGVVHAPEFVDLYNGMFYGELTRAAPDDPFPGYMPPPLDGVWATAPYLHNGSVPSIELVLNSKARPKYWKRVDLDDTNYDEDALGFPWEEVPYSQADAPDAEKKLIYDTTYWSQSNGGHTFGDDLSSADRRAVLEYLKTL